MIPIVASAPGKVLLSGEYAVLDGAPAIGAAVNRRASVTIESADSGWHIVNGPGHTETEGRFHQVSDGLQWRSGGEMYSLLEHVWLASKVTPDEMLSLKLDTRPFRDPHSGAKIGIGSSAALSVALATALCALPPGGDDAGGVAELGHRAFQHGLGSGVDVVCSLAGGVIEYRRDERQYRPVAWPHGLYYKLLWSGVQVETRAQLDKLQQADAQPSRNALGDAAEKIARIWRDGSAQRIVDEFGTYIDALRRFSIDHGLGIFDAGHAALVEMAARQGMVYKPCGAGGGDIGIVLGVDESALASFAASPVADGFTELDVMIDANGAQLVGAMQ